MRSTSGAEMLARKFGSAGRDHDADHRGRRGRRGRGAQRPARRISSRRSPPRHAHRQRLLRHVRACRGGPARRQARHHALASHAAVSCDLSEGEARARPDLRARRQHLEFGRHHRRHRPCAGDGRRGSRRRDRREDRAPARALSPPQRRAVAILLAARAEGADRALRAAARPGRASISIEGSRSRIWPSAPA